MLALQKNTSPSNCHSQQLIETEVTLSAAAILSLWHTATEDTIYEDMLKLYCWMPIVEQCWNRLAQLVNDVWNWNK